MPIKSSAFCFLLNWNKTVLLVTFCIFNMKNRTFLMFCCVYVSPKSTKQSRCGYREPWLYRRKNISQATIMLTNYFIFYFSFFFIFVFFYFVSKHTKSQNLFFWCFFVCFLWLFVALFFANYLSHCQQKNKNKKRCIDFRCNKGEIGQRHTLIAMHKTK